MKQISKQRIKQIIKRLHKHPYWVAYATGLLYYGYQLRWLTSIQTAQLVSPGIMQKIVGLSASVIMIASFALSLVLFVWLYRAFSLRTNQAQFIWLAPILWVCCEVIRSVGFSIVSAGPGSRVGNYWHYANIGLWLVDTPLVFLSRLGGLFVLTFSTGVMVAVLIYAVKTRIWWPACLIVVSLLALSGLTKLLSGDPQGRPLSVVAVGMVSPDDEDKPTDRILRTLSSVPAHSADVVYLPEYSHYWEYDAQQEADAMNKVLKDPKGLVIHSVSSRNFDRQYNDVTYSSGSGSILAARHKWFIIPGGEFVPYVYRGTLAMFGHRDLVAKFESTKAITPGGQHEQPFIWKDISFGALACSAATVPELYRQQVAQGAEVLSNAASLGTLGDNALYHQQGLAAAKLHAVANARPFIQSSRDGFVFAIDHNGRVIHSNTSRKDGALTAQITTNTKKTPYVFLGDIFAYAAVAYISVVVLIRYWRSRSKHKH